MLFQKTLKSLCLSSLITLVAACHETDEGSDPNTTPFTLNFKAMSGDVEIGCDEATIGIGPEGKYSIGVGDLRFYVSNLKFYNAAGGEVAPTIDDNDFQLNHAAGALSLIDFTHRDSGYCEEAQLGTPRTNTKITGTTTGEAISGVSFDVGVPQAVMKAVTADAASLTDAPSPLAEMTWGWANGYRHIDFNFTSMNDENTALVQNSGLHIGSKDCGTANKALAEQDACGLLYTPKVMLDNFDPTTNTVTFDIAAMLADTKATDYSAFIMGEIIDGNEEDCINAMRHNNKCPIGTKFGILCHSNKAEAGCISVFPSLGLDIETGLADSANNTVFGME